MIAILAEKKDHANFINLRPLFSLRESFTKTSDATVPKILDL
jgi:hypothetical protein